MDVSNHPCSRKPSMGSASSSSGVHSSVMDNRSLEEIEAIEIMRRRLKYHFMNPIEKYRAKGTIPYKLIIQIMKIVFVTLQIAIFGIVSSAHVNFLENNVIAFRHLFLKDWSSALETPPYPASHGPFAAYTNKEFHQMLNYTIERYFQVKSIALGQFDYLHKHPKLQFCYNHYLMASINMSAGHYEYDRSLVSSCFVIDNSTYKIGLHQLLRDHNVTINFMSLHEITLDFWLRTIQLKSLNLDSTPECYAFHIFIKIHGEITNSQLMVDLSTDLDKLSCRGSILNNSYNVRNLILAVDYGVILLSLISFFSCARSIYRGKQLYSKVRDFFTRTLKVSLGSDKWEFLSGWFILIIINDILVLMGTFIKVIFASKFGDYYTICSYFLGLGSMMVWIGVLRYVGFSYKNNILILTLCRAMPNVARFMLCAIVIFLAFTLCGWVVLGPYHVKFRSFSTTLECLYSLINGDELFATFSFIDQDKDFFIFLFSRIYIYLFCSLYIYVVLNLFITLIIEAYEDIKELRANGGKPNTFMWNFIRECPDDCDSALYRSDAFQTAFYRRQQRREKYSKYAENVLHPFVCAGRSICSGVSLVYDRCSSRTSAATGARHSPGDEDLFHPSQRPSNERSPLLVNS